MNTLIEIPLNITDDEGNVIDTTSVLLTAERIGSILDRAIGVVIASRNGDCEELGMNCAGLEQELAAYDVIDIDNLPPIRGY